MPSFFNFQTGDSSRAPTDSSPLLGRFRAVPDAQRRAQRNSLSLLGAWDGRRRSLGRGLGFYGGTFARLGGGGDGEGEDEDGERENVVVGWGRWMRDLWIEPKQQAVARAVERWWVRWVVLAVLPAALVSVEF
jgi:hypothetical protein